ncbi:MULTISPECIES: esterase [Thauera]|jgi:phospholipase/carboxylesterase|uniref:Phospholipase n=1 Tax=Thauera humireducens TaxID=1134435 RepID=A0A127K2Q0_9RHOO|nr:MULTISPECIES: esterase [Thauera]AMO36223.1 phospholipase [Thauera humireducens]ENO80277.1 phospholipase/carboxylesterase [Thauera sp. 63]
MSDQDLIVQHVPVPASRSILLFHGVGSRPEDLVPLAHLLAEAHPDAWVVSVRSPESSDLGSGWQWFSVRGVTEENRPARVAEAMPSFVRCVRDWQARAGVDAAATTLIGFSQGAIMALESTQLPETLAARVISLAGRFASAPRVAPAQTQVHLLHGERDQVIDPRYSLMAAETLRALGGGVSVELLPNLGHGVDARVASRVKALAG